MRILIAEDERDLNQLIKKKAEGCRIQRGRLL